MKDYKIIVNDNTYDIKAEPDTPLLWVLRDNLKLYGTKYGCGIGQCGACTVHMDGKAIRSCQLKINGLKNARITTIEGLSHPIKDAWKKYDVPQCGYCQAGQIMNAVPLIDGNPDLTEEDIDIHMNGNLCRCGTYLRIRKAIKFASKSNKDS